MARMNAASYEKLRSLSRGKISPQQFLDLKHLAANTVGVNNAIFDTELKSLLTLYKTSAEQISVLEAQIIELIEEVHPHYMSIPGMTMLNVFDTISTATKVLKTHLKMIHVSSCARLL